MNTVTKEFISITCFCMAIVLQGLCQSNPAFTELLIDDDFGGISAVSVNDIDKDGFPDVVAGSEYAQGAGGKGVGWWKNNGNDSWTKFIIDESYQNIMSLETIDLNNDENTDVIISDWSAHCITYWTSDDNSPPNWTEYILVSDFYNAHDAHAKDVNGDGRVDIVGVSDYLGEVGLWLQEENGTWAEQTVDNDFDGGKAVAISDFNKDGHVDIAAVSVPLNTIAIYYNDGGSPIDWSKQVVANDVIGVHEIISFDFDQDDDDDLITSAFTNGNIDIWLNDGGNIISWTKMPVGVQESVVRAVPADFNEDGNYDIAATGKFPGELSIWYNEGAFSFSKEVIDNSLVNAWAVEAVDINNDNHIDIVSGSIGEGLIKWWKNGITTAIHKDQIKKDPIIFPNPADGYLTIDGLNEGYGDVSVSLFNFHGSKTTNKQQTNQPSNNRLTIQTHSLPEGIYFLQISGKNYSITRKVLIKH